MRVYSHVCKKAFAWRRENREGWALLTVETEVNGDSRSTSERGPVLISLARCADTRYKRFLSCLG
jgi:hypothetical protein